MTRSETMPAPADQTARMGGVSAETVAEIAARAGETAFHLTAKLAGALGNEVVIEVIVAVHGA